MTLLLTIEKDIHSVLEVVIKTTIKLIKFLNLFVEKGNCKIKSVYDAIKLLKR